MKFTAILTGSINNEPIRLNGKGSINPQKGLTDGYYNLQEVPTDFSPVLLSAVLITGYPDASASLDGASNIFQGRSYEYNRNLIFGNGGELNLNTSCILKDDHLHSQFHLTGNVDLPPVDRMEPLIESWTPAGPGGIEGHFRAVWLGADGCTVKADAFTEYNVDTDQIQKRLLHRFVTIDSEVQGSDIHKLQEVMLFENILPSVQD